MSTAFARPVAALIAERRANIIEMSKERDATARAVLKFHIEQLDREIAEQTKVQA